MEKLKDLSIISLTYLTICGVLYHVIFGFQFNYNSLAYIGVSDILKSAVEPILKPGLETLLFGFFFFYIEGFANMIKGVQPVYIKPKNRNVYIWWTIVILFSIISILNSNEEKFPFNWVRRTYRILPILAALAVFPVRLNFLNSVTNNLLLVELLKVILVFLPFMCYSAARVNALLIKHNQEYHFIVKGNDTLKYLSNSESNFLFTDMKNNKLYYVKSDSLVLSYKQKP